MTILPLVPSPSLTPPALLIWSAAASSAALLLMPNERTTPDMAPKPEILTWRSCALMENEVPAVTIAATADDAIKRVIVMDRTSPCRFPIGRLLCSAAPFSVASAYGPLITLRRLAIQKSSQPAFVLGYFRA